MFGFGQSYNRGYGLYRRKVIETSKDGYTYIGHCRCGFGPNAFYQDANGRIVHASRVYCGEIREPRVEEDLTKEITYLKKEKEELEKRIKKIEEKLK